MTEEEKLVDELEDKIYSLNNSIIKLTQLGVKTDLTLHPYRTAGLLPAQILEVHAYRELTNRIRE